MRLLVRWCALVSLALGFVAHSQTVPERSADIFVDEQGVMRWKGAGTEVSLFGVNYTTPFAYAYRAHKRLGLSLKQAIDLDVAHMARLGLDAFRVHVWDREISDADGNLLPNEHLDLLDYLLTRLAHNGIKTIITPIAWWGNGWPEPDEMTKGFSETFSKVELITNSKARAAQRTYLRQFIDHINTYTRVAYKSDPSIIAVEIINEPRHPEDGMAVTGYVNEMVGILRDAGYAKPIFYNISENWNAVQANAVAAAHVDGVSFQWYPTGLVHGRMLRGNYLLNVSTYAIPSANVAGFANKARMVYEFDAADVGGSYMYPAMARSFREAGMQFATMFSYDPVQIAWSNTEYPTHFVNLLYAPSKAISLMIAGRAFRQLSRMQSYGTYPGNSQFEDFRVSGEADLSEMNSVSEFIYSKSTGSRPVHADSLTHVAGCGNSAVVKYDGTGAYFLDRLEPGIWRLEVYPDVLWLRDPFERTSMSRQVARLFWRERKMALALPDLGDDYGLFPMSKAKRSGTPAVRDARSVTPGIFIVAARTADRLRIRRYLARKERFLDGLYTPPTAGIAVVDHTCRYAVASTRTEFTFQIAGGQAITKAQLYVRRPGWRGFAIIPLTSAGGFDYVATDSSGLGRSGTLEYCVAVESGDTTLTFPGATPGKPDRWDFLPGTLWSLKLVEPGEPVVLLDVARDRDDLVFPSYSKGMKYNIEYRNGSNSEELALSSDVSFTREGGADFGIQLNCSDRAKAWLNSGDGFHLVRTRARSTRDSVCKVAINLLMSDGQCLTAGVELGREWHDVAVPLAAFRGGSALTLPGAYPMFLPKSWNAAAVLSRAAQDLRSLQCIQVVASGGDVAESKGKREVGFEIVSILVE
jgi:hypothetical protein